MERPLDAIDRRLLNDFQHGLPVVERPYAYIARELGIGEDEVIERLQRLRDQELVSRVGPVFRPNRLGVSTLAAMAVPAERLEAVARRISARPEVNHN
ncbi:MAG: Lrp/AsnC family transcriptional regulator, partial [Gammaproteobacteria bacterium]